MTKFASHLNNCSLEDAIKAFYNDNPFTNDLGININNISSDKILLSLKIEKRHTNVYNIAHGGVIMSLADTAIGAACLSLNKRVVTLDFNSNMLKAVPFGITIYAKTKIIHNGRQTIVVECSVEDDKNNLYCKSRATMFVLGQLQDNN